MEKVFESFYEVYERRGGSFGGGSSISFPSFGIGKLFERPKKKILNILEKSYFKLKLELIKVEELLKKYKKDDDDYGFGSSRSSKSSRSSRSSRSSKSSRGSRSSSSIDSLYDEDDDNLFDETPKEDEETKKKKREERRQNDLKIEILEEREKQLNKKVENELNKINKIASKHELELWVEDQLFKLDEKLLREKLGMVSSQSDKDEILDILKNRKQ